MPQGLFVIGSEPRAGCTMVSAALAAALRGRHRRVGVLKPVAVGCGLDLAVAGGVTVGGVPGVQDARSLAALSRLSEVAGPPPATLSGPTAREALRADEARRLVAACGEALPIDTVNPYRFAPDLEPGAAARAANVTIDVGLVQRCFDEVARGREGVVVDGGVGPLVPLNEGQTVLDLVTTLGLPVVLVVPSRPWGAINPTLLTVEVLRARGVALAGVVLNRRDRRLRPEEAANPYQIEAHAGALVRGLLPFLETEQLEPARLAERFEVHVDLDGILEAWRR